MLLSDKSEEPHGCIYTVNNVISCAFLHWLFVVSCLLVEGQMKALYSGVPHIFSGLIVWSGRTDRPPDLRLRCSFSVSSEAVLPLELQHHLFSLTWYTGPGRQRFLRPAAQNQIAPLWGFSVSRTSHSRIQSFLVPAYG